MQQLRTIRILIKIKKAEEKTRQKKNVRSKRWNSFKGRLRLRTSKKKKRKRDSDHYRALPILQLTAAAYVLVHCK